MLVYKRSAPTQEALIALNFSNHPQQVNLPGEDNTRAWQLLFGGSESDPPLLDADSLSLPAYGTAILSR